MTTRTRTTFLAFTAIALGVLWLGANLDLWPPGVNIVPVVILTVGLWLGAEQVFGGWSPGGWFLAVALVSGGSLLLLSQLGISDVLALWPLLLVAVGVGLLAGPLVSRHGVVSETFAAPWDGSAEARVVIRHRGGRLRVEGGSAPGAVADGYAPGGAAVEIRPGADRLTVVLTVPRKPWPAVGHHDPTTVDSLVRLAPAVPLALDCTTGASEAVMDLRDVPVHTLRVRGGASQLEVDLPRQGVVVAEVRGGAAEITVRVPPEVSARIRSRGGLAELEVDRERFPADGAGGFRSPDFAVAPNRVDLDVECGLASVRVV